MQYLLEHLGTTVSAISGVLAGRGKEVDLFGVIVLALVTAVGGGTLRDLILDLRPFWVADPWFVINASVSALLIFVVVRFHQLPLRLLLIADAAGLALFTVVGVEKALAANVAPTIAVVMGVMTGVAGGIIRDVLTGEVPMVFRRQIYLYATASFCGALVFIGLHDWLENPALRLTAAGTTLVLRLLAMQWRLRLPEFQAR